MHQSEMIGLRLQYFLRMSKKKIEITIVPREVGQIIDEIFDLILDGLTVAPPPASTPPPARLIKLANNEMVDEGSEKARMSSEKQRLLGLNPQNALYQGECYQQHTPNLCGYHAIFNTLCFLEWVAGEGRRFDCKNGSHFWSFKREIEQFLFHYKKVNKLKDQWPWRQQDILHGDFQRTYNKVCMEHFPPFSIFRSHSNFDLHHSTWEFQYSNLILSEAARTQLSTAFKQFQAHSSSSKSSKPIVLSLMLAITNHWMCFQAVKIGKQNRYWFWDSFNRNTLNLSEDEITQLVDNIEKERLFYKKVGFSPFFKKNIAVCMKDTQISLRLIIDCLEGKTTLEQYTYNQAFNIFASNILQDSESKSNTNAKVQQTIKQYWINIQTFFRSQIRMDLLSEYNFDRLAKLVKLAESSKDTQMGNKLWRLLRRYN